MSDVRACHPRRPIGRRRVAARRARQASPVRRRPGQGARPPRDPRIRQTRRRRRSVPSAKVHLAASDQGGPECVRTTSVTPRYIAEAKSRCSRTRRHALRPTARANAHPSRSVLSRAQRIGASCAICHMRATSAASDGPRGSGLIRSGASRPTSRSNRRDQEAADENRRAHARPAGHSNMVEETAPGPRANSRRFANRRLRDGGLPKR